MLLFGGFGTALLFGGFVDFGVLLGDLGVFLAVAFGFFLLFVCFDVLLVLFGVLVFYCCLGLWCGLSFSFPCGFDII